MTCLETAHDSRVRRRRALAIVHAAHLLLGASEHDAPRVDRGSMNKLLPGSLCTYEPRSEDGRSYLLSPELALIVSVAAGGRYLLMLRRGSGTLLRWVPHHWVRTAT
jgi:hypothetical protein